MESSEKPHITGFGTLPAGQDYWSFTKPDGEIGYLFEKQDGMRWAGAFANISDKEGVAAVLVPRGAWPGMGIEVNMSDNGGPPNMIIIVPEGATQGTLLRSTIVPPANEAEKQEALAEAQTLYDSFHKWNGVHGGHPEYLSKYYDTPQEASERVIRNRAELEERRVWIAEVEGVQQGLVGAYFEADSERLGDPPGEPRGGGSRRKRRSSKRRKKTKKTKKNRRTRNRITRVPEQHGGARCDCAGTAGGGRQGGGCKSSTPHENGKCGSGWFGKSADWGNHTGGNHTGGNHTDLNFCGRCLRNGAKSDDHVVVNCRMCDVNQNLLCPHKDRGGSRSVVCPCAYCEHDGDRWAGKQCRCAECRPRLKVEFPEGCPSDYLDYEDGTECERGDPCYHCDNGSIIISSTSAQQIIIKRSNELYQDLLNLV